ncbi:acyl-CoA dehydrogenase [Sphingobium sp. SCG-1]|uniref:acyl-CoA dehydrogenase family protein n=1 Tax=Sphingobium sp. SCG-1 TaxID=2072936 RepID=UPI000CD69CA7|nr:acyl-CoA dehydrogenase family protein [Sphingobium sp. SCG-1]AUW57125.1 acyl-CoA dehydrogenase [Sphingobium sp. SCG-1]
MRFHPTEEQEAIVAAVRGTLGECWAPRLRNFAEGEADFDAQSWQALMNLGLTGLMVPEDRGGIGLGLVDAALVMEAAGMAAAPGPLGAQMLASMLLSSLPSERSRDWLKALLEGSRIATMALGGNWIPESWNVAFDGFAVNGEVRFVLGAGSADFFIVGTTDGGLALVERGDAVLLKTLLSSDHTRRLSSVTFQAAPATLLCAAGDPLVPRLFDAMLVLSAAEALGAAQYCLDLSVSYAQQRVQFGQPIGSFQALKHQLADLALEVEPARALLWYAAYAQDAGLPDRHRAAAIAKAHIADRFVSVARGSVAAHGGIGYTWEYELSHWFRRSLFDHAWLGTPAQHRARAAALAEW